MSGPSGLPPRELGRYGTGVPGPTVVLFGGLHGNEPAGARAIGVVLAQLRERRLPLRGELVGLCGNRRALAAGRRYLDRDLNRGWLPEQIARLWRADRTAAEDLEQRELLLTLTPLLAAAREPIVFLDLHSTSGDGPPFTCMADVLRNRPVAFALPVPLILGIEEILEGSLMGYLCDLGHVAVAVEGGQSEAARTQRHHEAAIWLTLVSSGALAPGEVPGLEQQRRLLAEAARDLPAVIEVRHRHLVREDDGFAMEPGWASFLPVRAGQAVARDRSGAVRAPETGLMLMPRYQGQGEDGYFLAREVSPFWLRVSAGLRALRVDLLAPLLPGVRRDPAEPDRLLANPRVARFQRVNVFHLLGYRHVRSQPGGVAFARRRPGFRGLRPLPAELLPALEPPLG